MAPDPSANLMRNNIRIFARLDTVRIPCFHDRDHHNGTCWQMREARHSLAGSTGQPSQPVDPMPNCCQPLLDLLCFSTASSHAIAEDNNSNYLKCALRDLYLEAESLSVMVLVNCNVISSQIPDAPTIVIFASRRKPPAANLARKDSSLSACCLCSA